jgi:hypothetical protein
MDDEQKKKRKIESQRLMKAYGIDLEGYETLSTIQKDVCAICGRKAFGRKLAVDHDHTMVRVKVTFKRDALGLWYAEIKDPRFSDAQFLGSTKGEARFQATQWLKRRSIRGLLCMQCNRGLKWWNDKEDKIRAAADYLAAFRTKYSG